MALVFFVYLCLIVWLLALVIIFFEFLFVTLCVSYLGHLKTLGTQMGYPIAVLIWVVVKINDQTGFWFISLSRKCQPCLSN